MLDCTYSKTVEEDQDLSFDLQEEKLELAFDEFGEVEAEIEWLKKENKILGIRWDFFQVSSTLEMIGLALRYYLTEVLRIR